MPEPSDQYPLIPPDQSPPDDQVRCTPFPPDIKMVLVSEDDEGPKAMWVYWTGAIAQWPVYIDNGSALAAGAPLGTPYKTPTGSLRVVVAPE